MSIAEALRHNFSHPATPLLLTPVRYRSQRCLPSAPDKKQSSLLFIPAPLPEGEGAAQTEPKKTPPNPWGIRRRVMWMTSGY